MPDLDFARSARPGLFTLIVSAGELALVPLAFLIAKVWRPEEPLPPVEIELRSLGLGVLGTLPPTAVLLWMFSRLGRDFPLVRRVRDMLGEVAGATFGALSFWQMAVLSLSAGIGEEMLFRGVLQPRLGILLASLVFGLLHPFSLFYVALTTLFGLYLGWMAREGGLLVPIVTHALYDLFALWVIRRENLGTARN